MVTDSMDPSVQLYLVYGGLLVLSLAGVGVAWRMSRRRRRPIPETPEKEEAAPEAGGLHEAPTRRKLTLVPAEPETSLADGLGRTRAGFVARIAGVLQRKEIDAQLVDQLEEVLYTADIGTRPAARLLEAVRQELGRNELKDPAAVWSSIRRHSQEILESAAQDSAPLDVGRATPFVVLVVGVNGVGKTTTIGKLAARFHGAGKKVLLAAGDTFRAAAVEQLERWGERVGVPVVRGKEGADPSSVIFDAVRRAESDGFDVVIADTAGRLHTKTNLMEELQKVRRVIQKAMPEAPHETLLVLDATNGQNAIAQATTFKEATQVTGIVLTKLDGTAKGGVILGICEELKVPVRFIGIGEKVGDLREFEPAAFVDALYGRAEDAGPDHHDGVDAASPG